MRIVIAEERIGIRFQQKSENVANPRWLAQSFGLTDPGDQPSAGGQRVLETDDLMGRG
jgi:hypothetical protein